MILTFVQKHQLLFPTGDFVCRSEFSSTAGEVINAAEESKHIDVLGTFSKDLYFIPFTVPTSPIPHDPRLGGGGVN